MDRRTETENDNLDWLNPDLLIEFIDQLRASGYKIDISKYIAAQDLILILIGRGENLDSPESLRSLLAPIFCTSPTEQAEFQYHFDNWVKYIGQSRFTTIGEKDGLQAKKPIKSRSVLVILSLIFIGFTGTYIFSIPKPLTPPPPIPETKPKTKATCQPESQSTKPKKPKPLQPKPTLPQTPIVKGPLICIDKIDISINWSLGLVFFFTPFAVFWIGKLSWFLLARRLFLQRYGMTEQPELHHISIAGVEQDLFPPAIFIQTARNLRRRIPIPCDRLDVEKTIEKSLSRWGWFTPIYRSYQVIPEYLFLVNRNSFQDHQAQFVEEMIDRLKQDKVLITSYFFDDDPLICFPSDGQGTPMRLDEIVSKYSQYYLVVVSDAGKFFSPISGELESWVSQLILWKDHAVLTPKPQSNWGDQEDELEVEQEFILLPATPEGLRDLSQRLSGKVYNPPISQDNGLDFSPLPEMLRLRPRRWLERNSPEPEKVVMMLDLLAEYLGKDGFYWFCACAVFPELQWNITLYLGDVLKTEEGKSLLESCSLMNLTRLPWFRYGYIPDWLRVYLIEALTQEQDQSIRIALRNLLDRVNQTSEGGLTLSIATKPLKNQSDKFFSQLTQIFSGRVSENSPLQDYLFLDFMTKPSPLALRVPEKFGGLVSKSQKSGSEKGKINRRRFLEMLGLGIAGFVSVIAGKRAFETRTLQLTKGCETFQFDVLTVNKQGQIISRRPGQAKSFVEQLGNNVTLEMVEIPGNSFTMGSPLGEKSCYDSEQPQRVVNVSAFLMSKFTVTQAQYQQVMGKNPSYFKGEKRPVEQVSWDDAVEFCKRLSQKSGGKYRLPTEAEWEYACRAGTTTPFYFGETITSDLANYNGNYTYASEPKGKYRQETTDVGSFPPNAFGLYDMRGNVWEWCQDTWHENYEGAPTDATAWITEKEDSSRVLRGGS